MAGRPGVLASRPWLRAWLACLLAAWVLLGVLLVTRANTLGVLEDVSFSPYHLVGYAALLVLAAYVAWAFFRGLRHGAWRAAFPPLYGGLGLGLVLFLGWVVLDPIWRDTLGIGGGIENGLAPTRLLIPAGLVLLAAGPVREAIGLRRIAGKQPGERAVAWAGVVAAGVVGASLTLVALNPIQNPVNDWARIPGADNSEIWTMAADGSGQTRLLAAKGDGVDYSLPAWSPDGGRIAYTVWTNDDGVARNIDIDAQTTSIWTMAADGSDRRVLVEGGDEQPWIPAWSPDGEWLVYTRTPHATPAAGAVGPQPAAAPGQVGPPSAVGGSSIWIVRADGTDARQLSPQGVDAVGAAWAPDGRRIAFVAATPGQPQNIHVATVAEDGLTDEQVVGAAGGEDWGPAWSADGTQIVFVSNRSGNDDIWITTIGGGLTDTRRLTDHAAGDVVPAFMPDGSRIAFVSERTGEPEIWTMAPDGSDLRNLTQHPGHLDGQWSVAWSPDGTRLAYATAAFGDPASSGWVVEDLAVAQALLFGVALAVVALLVVALGAPRGAFAVVLLLVAAAAAVPKDAWGFVAPMVIAGALVDVLVALVPHRWRRRAAAAGLPAAATLATALGIGVGGTLAWSTTLLLGVALASGLLGWGLAEAVKRLFGGADGTEPEATAPTPARAPAPLEVR